MDPAELQSLLQQLRDPHSPAPPGWWPPAPGWWAIALLALCAVALLCRFLQKRRSDWRTSALAGHRLLAGSDLATAAQRKRVVGELSVQMRRVALANNPRSAVAPLEDDEWLAALDRLDGSDCYSNGVGQLIARSPYAPVAPDEQQLRELLRLTAATIRRAGAGAARSGSRLAGQQLEGRQC